MTLMRGRGVIIPVEWDENGNVLAIGISTHEEDEYFIEDEGKGVELRGLVRQEVEVFGEVRKINAKRFIKVTKYKVRKGNGSWNLQ
jgi:predicted RNA-binding protein